VLKPEETISILEKTNHYKKNIFQIFNLLNTINAKKIYFFPCKYPIFKVFFCLFAVSQTPCFGFGPSPSSPAVPTGLEYSCDCGVRRGGKSLIHPKVSYFKILNIPIKRNTPQICNLSIFPHRLILALFNPLRCMV